MLGKRSWDARTDRAAARIPLKLRRRKARQITVLVVALILVLCIGAVLYGISRPEIRITRVDAAGAHADATPAVVRSAIAGKYFYLIPKDSILFVPEEKIRQAILAAYPDIAAVSVSRTGRDTLFINAVPRVQAFTWCGSGSDEPLPTCYEADAEGLIFAVVAPVLLDASSTDTVHTLHIYAPLAEAMPDTPIRMHVAAAASVPDILRFVRAMGELGALVTSVQIRGDEADLYLTSGTRVTYLIGHEIEAAGLAATAFPNLNLRDGSVLYVDLRFDGKVYYKKKGEE